MPAKSRKIPSYRLHRPTGQAVVRLDGRDHYLGRHGSDASREKYNRMIAGWLTTGQAKPPETNVPVTDALTVGEVILAFLTRHADVYYRRADGTPTGEAKNLEDALRPLRRLYGRTNAASFDSVSLMAVRQEMILSGLARTTINARINRIRRVFRWAASLKLVPASVAESLRTVDGLREGRTKARESAPVEPVPIARVEATVPFMPRPVAAMVRLQLLTGCRSGEIMAMRGCDLSPGEPTWEYRPGSHKNAWRGHDRVIPLGPKAQAIVREFLKPDLTAYLFSPRETVQAHHSRRSQTRTTKRTPSEAKRRAATPGQKHSPRYDRGSYRQAVVRACHAAFPHPTVAALKARASDRGLTREERGRARAELQEWTRENRDAMATWRREHRWSPLQLRHAVATAIRARYGLESAQVVLGHARADVTQLYAERDTAKARDLMAEIG